MKQLIDVRIEARRDDFAAVAVDLLAVGVFDSKRLDPVCGRLDGLLGGAIGRLIKLGDFTGKTGSTALLYTDGRIAAGRVLLVGMGEKKNATVDTLRRAAACAAKKAVAIKAKTLGVALHGAMGAEFDYVTMGRASAEGAYLGSYRYDEFVTGDGNQRASALDVKVIDPEAPKKAAIGKGIATGEVIGRAHCFARTLANRPANVVSPAVLASEARKLPREVEGLTCTILDNKQLSSKGMGGILAVGAGSANTPKLIILRYSPPGRRRRPAVALVGKAVTFDAGGISIKPAAHMNRMKLDKSGGAAVMAAIKAAAELKLALDVYGIIPAAENMPSGSSYRPGDIITTFSGKTVEVQNTDAEGRMLLCDAISYADKLNCEIIIDIATLTGSCLVALGRHMAGLMGNDRKLTDRLLAAADESGEKLWLLPSGDEYAEEVKSKIADLKNIGGRWGGACTAAAFLRQFAAGRKWAHLDIAGVDLLEKDTEFSAEGSSGFGVRLLTMYLIGLQKK
jgi:leucyl aminopeptidase